MDLEHLSLFEAQEPFFIRQLETEDISLLISSRFFSGTRKEGKVRIESIINFAGKGNAYLFKADNSHNGMILCGFSATDSVTNQATLWIRQADARASGPYTSIDNPTDSIMESENANEDIAFSFESKVLSFLLYEGFHRRKFHKLNLCVNERDAHMIELLDLYQWNREGVFRDHFSESGQYSSGIQYAILKNDFSLYSTSLIPFLNGYLAVQATNDAVFGVSILKEGEPVPEFIAENDETGSRISEKNKIKRPSDPHQIIYSAKAYPYLRYASSQLFEYTSGNRKQFELSFEFSGATDFQQQVWNATIQVPFGQTRTYEEIARKLKPKDKNTDVRLLSRAVGTALGKNAIMIAIPCHRVIGKDGKLKGFAGGLEVKDYLLSHEMLSLK